VFLVFISSSLKKFWDWANHLPAKNKKHQRRKDAEVQFHTAHVKDGTCELSPISFFKFTP